jgi:uncharacterized coiled-coil protein SlyX
MKNGNLKLTATLLALGFLALCPIAQAVTPPPDGGYPGLNTAEGQNALFSRTNGVWNTALGALTLYSDTTGSGNTAVGINGLHNNITGAYNTAAGLNTLYFNNGDANTGAGSENSAFGASALFHNTTGSVNCAFGTNALFYNSTGNSNCAFGSDALYLNTSGLYNTAIGRSALFSNNASDNTAVGEAALNSNGEGIDNTATGAFALSNNTSGNFNTAMGFDALGDNGTGGANTAVGAEALIDTTGGANTALGFGAGANVTTGSFNVYIGTNVGGVANEVGHTYISNINSTVQPAVNGADWVTIRLSDGLLGHTSSSRRYKEDIKSMDNASDALYRLKPVTYRYKREIDPSQNLDYGLVAEDVAKVDPKLAIRDRNGQVEGVRYSAIYNMLLNEFLKEHKKIDTQQATITELQSTVVQQQKGMELLTAQLKEQAAQIQKVSAKVEFQRSPTNVVLNNR